MVHIRDYFLNWFVPCLLGYIIQYCPKGKEQTNWKRTRIWAVINFERGLMIAKQQDPVFSWKDNIYFKDPYAL